MHCQNICINPKRIGPWCREEGKPEACACSQPSPPAPRAARTERCPVTPQEAPGTRGWGETGTGWEAVEPERGEKATEREGGNGRRRGGDSRGVDVGVGGGARGENKAAEEGETGERSWGEPRERERIRRRAWAGTEGEPCPAARCCPGDGSGSERGPVMGCGGSRADAIEPRYYESWTRETESTWLTNTDSEGPPQEGGSAEAGGREQGAPRPGEWGPAAGGHRRQPAAGGGRGTAVIYMHVCRRAYPPACPLCLLFGVRLFPPSPRAAEGKAGGCEHPAARGARGIRQPRRSRPARRGATGLFSIQRPPHGGVWLWDGASKCHHLCNNVNNYVTTFFFPKTSRSGNRFKIKRFKICQPSSTLPQIGMVCRNEHWSGGGLHRSWSTSFSFPDLVSGTFLVVHLRHYNGDKDGKGNEELWSDEGF